MERLDKILASQTSLSRTEAKRAIHLGQVLVDGQVASSPEQKVDPMAQKIIAFGKPIAYQKHLYLMLHKPAGVLSASRDSRQKTVLDLVPDHFRRAGLAPVGRLDKNTTGLLLLTDDGDFAHRIISPKSGVTKIYDVALDADLKPDLPERFLAGVTLADGTKCLPAKLDITGPRTALVEICEGKYHQIKRMFGAVGLGVESLHRRSIGGLLLPPDLAAGACRMLKEEDFSALGVFPNDCQ